MCVSEPPTRDKTMYTNEELRKMANARLQTWSRMVQERTDKLNYFLKYSTEDQVEVASIIRRIEVDLDMYTRKLNEVKDELASL
jgi:hypothetical protein